MTNEQIIFIQRLKLAEAGTIGTTGRMIQVQNAAGEVKTIAEPEQIHTYSAWAASGYQVRKGEKARATFATWKQGKSRTVTDADGNEITKPGKMFLKESYFFTASQVDRITK